jgi:hypothetical protein
MFFFERMGERRFRFGIDKDGLLSAFRRGGRCKCCHVIGDVGESCCRSTAGLPKLEECLWLNHWILLKRLANIVPHIF